MNAEFKGIDREIDLDEVRRVQYERSRIGLTPLAGVKKVFIPDGVWYEFQTGKKFIGGKHYRTFYRDEDYPVYAKAGSIIPMAHINEDNFNSVDNPTQMDIHIFPGRSNNYSIYEDDGSTRLYEQGYFIVTNIHF